MNGVAFMISSLASVSVQSSYPVFAGRAGASLAADDAAAKRAVGGDAPTGSSAAPADASSPAASAVPGEQLTLPEERLLDQLRQMLCVDF